MFIYAMFSYLYLQNAPTFKGLKLYSWYLWQDCSPNLNILNSKLFSIHMIDSEVMKMLSMGLVKDQIVQRVEVGLERVDYKGATPPTFLNRSQRQDCFDIC